MQPLPLTRSAVVNSHRAHLRVNATDGPCAHGLGVLGASQSGRPWDRGPCGSGHVGVPTSSR